MAEQRKNSFFEGAFGRFVLPGIIIQSTLIGGGYATGREVVSYGAKFGAMGWIAGLTIVFGFGLMAFLMFEIARRFRAYDYRSLVKQFLGPFWFLYDIIYFLLAILIISIVIAATGSILESTLGLNYWVGVGVIAILAGILNFYGTKLIERFKTVGTTALLVAYILFAILVISSSWGEITNVFATGDTSFAGDFTIWSIIGAGIIYVGYNLAVYPAALFTVKRQKSIKDTLIGGAVAGVLMTVPWFLTYFALMGFYPSEAVFTAEVPWLEMLDGYGLWIGIIFGIVVGWTLIETATGMIHAFLDRVNHNLEELGKEPMSKGMDGTVAIVALVLSAILSSVGIDGLVSTGYTVLGYAMLIVYGIPILLIGSYKIVKGVKSEKSTKMSA
ncbi:YkvI family membrane protein [Lentibacillus juripiscarius]|uniref:Membrane protein YkvI n=1 Tax=Lentibacillus juripiscarius TaxID=257446 RepID=A0ABW5V338_9BACI